MCSVGQELCVLTGNLPACNVQLAAKLPFGIDRTWRAP